MHPTTEGGLLLDLDWSWVRALRNFDIGELRIHDTIGGFNNLRIIFFKGAAATAESLPIIWIIRVMQKKRDDFSAHDLATFKARRELIMERFYLRHEFE